MLQLIYARRHAIGSMLIRGGSWWAPWSHVGVVTPDDTVIEAVAWRGVIETSMADFIARHSKTAIVSVACPEPVRAVAYGRTQLGKGYDWLALLGIPLREPWEDADRWICAELAEACLAAGGRQRFRVAAGKITPYQSYMVM